MVDKSGVFKLESIGLAGSQLPGRRETAQRHRLTPRQDRNSHFPPSPFGAGLAVARARFCPRLARVPSAHRSLAFRSLPSTEASPLIKSDERRRQPLTCALKHTFYDTSCRKSPQTRGVRPAPVALSCQFHPQSGPPACHPRPRSY